MQNLRIHSQKNTYQYRVEVFVSWIAWSLLLVMQKTNELLISKDLQTCPARKNSGQLWLHLPSPLSRPHPWFCCRARGKVCQKLFVYFCNPSCGAHLDKTDLLIILKMTSRCQCDFLWLIRKNFKTSSICCVEAVWILLNMEYSSLCYRGSDFPSTRLQQIFPTTI